VWLLQKPAVDQTAVCHICGREIESYSAALDNWDGVGFDTEDDGRLFHWRCKDGNDSGVDR